jgi:type I restriction enzyme R subunit
MTDVVGQTERVTQNRVVRLFRERLGYRYLGNWLEREGNSNIEEALLRAYLARQGYSEVLIGKAMYELQRVAEDVTRSLYDSNRAVYGLLRYGVQVSPEVGENKETVRLID